MVVNRWGLVVDREAFLVLASALAMAACGASPPARSTTEPAASDVSVPKLSSDAADAGASVSASPAKQPEPAPEIDVLTTEEALGGFPGPTCEEALSLPPPGRTEEHQQIRIGAIQVNGRVDPATIIAAIKQQGRGPLGGCAPILPISKWPVMVQAKIRLDVDGIGIEQPTDGLDPLTACVQRAVTALHFPKPTSGVVTFVAPFAFEKTRFVPDTSQMRAWENQINAPCRAKKKKP